MGWQGNNSKLVAPKWHHSSIKKRRKEHGQQWRRERRLSLGGALYRQIRNSLILWVSLLFTLQYVAGGQAFVIAPPWANPEVNRCSRTSWQLIYWPDHDQCYQIFEQGPCPKSQELGFNGLTKRAECRCPKSLLYWPAADRCYEEFSRGPCEVNQYLVKAVATAADNKAVTSAAAAASGNSNQLAQCKNTEICANGWIFWPPHQQCYQLYTQGPCHKGDLLIMNALTAEPYCGCDPLLLRQYYFSPLRLCYEHNTKGPCEIGLLFAYNHTAELTHCMCSPDQANYHPESQQCFQFGSKGPCKKGQIFDLEVVSGYGECRCREGYVYWPGNGECYKTFTPGPCNPSHFMVPSDSNPNIGVCISNPCPRAHLFFPNNLTFSSGDSGSIASYVSALSSSTHSDLLEGKCHKVGSKGPCPLGQLVVFEKYSGKSYRGECGCSAGYNQNYWPDTDQCYEWYSRGPCKESFLFAYNRDEGKTECICDEQEGFVFWNETGKCYRVYSQGPCPDNAWLIPADDLSEVFCECKTGFRFSPESYACLPSPELMESIGLQMFPFLNNYKMMLTGGQPMSPDGSRKPMKNSAGRNPSNESRNTPENGSANNRRKTDTTDSRRGLINWTRGIFVTPAGQKTPSGGGRFKNRRRGPNRRGSDVSATENEPRDIPKRLLHSATSFDTTFTDDEDSTDSPSDVNNYSSYERTNYRSRRRHYNHHFRRGNGGGGGGEGGDTVAQGSHPVDLSTSRPHSLTTLAVDAKDEGLSMPKAAPLRGNRQTYSSRSQAQLEWWKRYQAKRREARSYPFSRQS